MKFEASSSFDRAFSKLPQDRQERVEAAISALVDFFEKQQKTPGLGLKHLRKSFWEIRAGLKDRVLFTFGGATVQFVMVGNHDEIRRALRVL